MDGLALAIEFAAAHAAMLGVRHVASHLEYCFGLLTSGCRTVLAKQQTLSAVVSDAGYPEWAVPEGIAHLVEKSFVIPEFDRSPAAGGRCLRR